MASRTMASRTTATLNRGRDGPTQENKGPQMAPSSRERPALGRRHCRQSRALCPCRAMNESAERRVGGRCFSGEGGIHDLGCSLLSKRLGDSKRVTQRLGAPSRGGGGTGDGSRRLSVPAGGDVCEYPLPDSPGAFRSKWLEQPVTWGALHLQGNTQVEGNSGDPQDIPKEQLTWRGTTSLGHRADGHPSGRSPEHRHLTEKTATWAQGPGTRSTRPAGARPARAPRLAHFRSLTCQAAHGRGADEPLSLELKHSTRWDG